jgi:hypothetical protein
MRHSTKTKDIKAVVDRNEALAEFTKKATAHTRGKEMPKPHREALLIQAKSRLSGEDHPLLESAEKFLRTYHDAMSIPAARRKQAEHSISRAEHMSQLILFTLGSVYSGNTSNHTEWGDTPKAETFVDRGSQYSRRCTYHKTNAVHEITLDAAGVIRLAEEPLVAELSNRMGYPLIALYPNGVAVYVRSCGMRIVSETVFIASGHGLIAHSKKSLEDAIKKLNKAFLNQTKERLAA